jgi:serine/threonine-protein kinase
VREPGSIVADRYLLDELIGEGGMAQVWAATHRVTGRHVALKFLPGAKSDSEEARQRFLREARAASIVQHPNVVPVHDVMTLDDGTLMMVMDRLYGVTLREHLEDVARMPIEETATLLAQVASAVGSAHAAGVVHRDLKPENIFITDEGDVRVLDFGIAKLTLADQQGLLTNTGAVLGTPAYMAPEQIFGERDLDARADIWSLGVMLYECLSGVRPFEGDNAGQIIKAVLHGDYVSLAERASDIPPDVCALVDAMLDIDRQERCADLREAFEVLREHTQLEGLTFEPSMRGMSLPPAPRSSARGVTSAPVMNTLESNTLETRTPRETPPIGSRMKKQHLLVGATLAATIIAALVWVGSTTSEAPSSSSDANIALAPSTTAPSESAPSETAATETAATEPVTPATASTAPSAAPAEPSASAAPSRVARPRPAAQPRSSAATPAPPASSSRGPLDIHSEVPF